MTSDNKVKHPIITRLGEILQDSDGLFNLLKLNILFFFTALPIIPFVSVFTFGGRMTAISVCIRKMVKTGNISDVSKIYFSLFKKHFKTSALFGAAVYIMTSLFSGGFYIYITMASSNILFIPFASFSLIALISVWCISVHLFVTLENYNLPDKKALVKYSISQVMLNFKKTITSVLIGFVIFTGIVLFLPATIPLIMTCAFSVPALAAGFAHTEPEFII